MLFLCDLSSVLRVKKVFNKFIFHSRTGWIRWFGWQINAVKDYISAYNGYLDINTAVRSFNSYFKIYFDFFPASNAYSFGVCYANIGQNKWNGTFTDWFQWIIFTIRIIDMIHFDANIWAQHYGQQTDAHKICLIDGQITNRWRDSLDWNSNEKDASSILKKIVGAVESLFVAIHMESWHRCSKLINNNRATAIRRWSQPIDRICVQIYMYILQLVQKAWHFTYPILNHHVSF